ncbi:Flp family type IVb pilin [Hyphomonas oceanitis]|uniref:Component of type IV pilus, pilin subunit protein n=1 Tax=Hyphomonas oceanitis SCH89 TaxID=1280953 RepID=A0A059G7K6_9PROT|nr:Flp family type IVb pilin [Hyphomonas oceanitis]KDA02438.1 component of type IV pilus, pilin subunit protein [Hyphomonas oceanitis SCH89]
MGLKTTLLRWTHDERGATAIEYGLILALICIAIIGGATLMGNSTGDAMQNAADQFPS